MGHKPNIFYVCVDQLRYQSRGYGGDQKTRTDCMKKNSFYEEAERHGETDMNGGIRTSGRRNRTRNK
ncbi:MAG: hypothetical protein QGI34_12905 [Candidatus Latescibacteria bacterium]|jgi:hypothetical protein|nr:hypothetical protein [Candidatus Latescibacterota bacterium]